MVGENPEKLTTLKGVLVFKTPHPFIPSPKERGMAKVVQIMNLFTNKKTLRHGRNYFT